MNQSSTVTTIIIVVFGLVVVGGLIAIFLIAPKINQNLKKLGDNIYNQIVQQENVIAISPYFFLVPKIAPKAIGILVLEENSIAIYLRKKKIFKRFAYTDIKVVEFPRDVLYSFIKITKQDGSIEEVKFGQDLDLIQAAQGANKAVENLQATNNRFRNILVQKNVAVI